MSFQTHESAAIHILDWLHRAEDALVGFVVSTTTGERGIVKEIELDEHHGLCFTFEDPLSGFDIVECGMVRKFYPVSVIKQREVGREVQHRQS